MFSDLEIEINKYYMKTGLKTVLIHTIEDNILVIFKRKFVKLRLHATYWRCKL